MPPGNESEPGVMPLSRRGCRETILSGDVDVDNYCSQVKLVLREDDIPT